MAATQKLHKRGSRDIDCFSGTMTLARARKMMDCRAFFSFIFSLNVQFKIQLLIVRFILSHSEAPVLISLTS